MTAIDIVHRDVKEELAWRTDLKNHRHRRQIPDQSRVAHREGQSRQQVASVSLEKETSEAEDAQE